MQLSKKKYSIIKRIEKHVKLTMEKNQKQKEIIVIKIFLNQTILVQMKLIKVIMIKVFKKIKILK